jgi:hypothetical protein
MFDCRCGSGKLLAVEQKLDVADAFVLFKRGCCTFEAGVLQRGICCFAKIALLKSNAGLSGTWWSQPAANTIVRWAR